MIKLRWPKIQVKLTLRDYASMFLIIWGIAAAIIIAILEGWI